MNAKTRHQSCPTNSEHRERHDTDLTGFSDRLSPDSETLDLGQDLGGYNLVEAGKIGVNLLQ